MKGFTKNPFGANRGRNGGAPLPQHDIENPFEDEEMLENQLNEVSIQGGSSQHYNNDEDDLHLGDDTYGDYGAPPTAAPAKKAKKPAGAKTKKAANSHYGESQTQLTPMPPSQPTSSPTAFVMPPPAPQSTATGAAAPGATVGAHASATAAAAGQQAKKYLNSVTTYFNEKKDAIRGRGDGTDPELSGEMDDTMLREAALKRREAELLAKEQKVAEREREVRQFEGKLNNWPFKWWAILYHNIADDILPENQRFVTSFYYLWMFELFCLAFQFVAILVDVFSGSCSASILTILWNAVFCCCGLFGSWFLWYKVIYDASKKASIGSISYGRFTCGFFVHWAWVVVMLTGIWASDGIISLLQTITGGCHASAVFFVIGTVAWGLNFLWSSWMSKLAYSKYKGSGHTLSSIKGDFLKAGAKAALSRGGG